MAIIAPKKGPEPVIARGNISESVVVAIVVSSLTICHTVKACTNILKIIVFYPILQLKKIDIRPYYDYTKFISKLKSQRYKTSN